MQELIDKMARETAALFTFTGTVQLTASGGIVSLAVWLGRRVHTTTYARALEAQAGLTARLSEGLIIICPHMVTLVLTAILIQRGRYHYAGPAARSGIAYKRAGS